jgi:hypothetical protein
MAPRTLTVFLAFAISLPALGSTADAASKRHKRVAKHAATQQQPKFRQEPPRMYEVRPGHWISTWGCFTDEGYGRIGSCDMREGPM